MSRDAKNENSVSQGENGVLTWKPAYRVTAFSDYRAQHHRKGGRLDSAQSNCAEYPCSGCGLWHSREPTFRSSCAEEWTCTSGRLCLFYQTPSLSCEFLCFCFPWLKCTVMDCLLNGGFIHRLRFTLPYLSFIRHARWIKIIDKGIYSETSLGTMKFFSVHLNISRNIEIPLGRIVSCRA